MLDRGAGPSGGVFGAATPLLCSPQTDRYALFCLYPLQPFVLMNSKDCLQRNKRSLTVSPERVFSALGRNPS